MVPDTILTGYGLYCSCISAPDRQAFPTGKQAHTSLHVMLAVEADRSPGVVDAGQCLAGCCDPHLVCCMLWCQRLAPISDSQRPAACASATQLLWPTVLPVGLPTGLPTALPTGLPHQVSFVNG